MKSFLVFFAFAVAAAQICLAQNSDAAPRETDAINAARAKFLAAKFEGDLRNSKALGGAICVVVNGEILVAEDFDFSPPDAQRSNMNRPLGESSLALLSMLALSMAEEGLVKPDAPVADYCSLFRLANTPSPKTSLGDLLSMRGPFDSHADTLVPADSSAAELFDVAAQMPPVPFSPYKFERSNLQAALAGYVLGYVGNKGEKNMKKSFAACTQKYLFDKLDIQSAGYRNFKSALFPSSAYSISIEDCAKWLSAETSKTPKISSFEIIAERRIPKAGRFENGWLSSQDRGVSFFICGDYFEGTANIIAVFPHENAAVAFFARTPDKRLGPKICASALGETVDLILNPPEPSARRSGRADDVLPLTQ